MKVYKLLNYIFVILAFLNSGYALNTTKYNFSFPLLFINVIALILIIAYRIKVKEKIFIKVNIAFIAICTFMLVFAGSYIVHGNSESGETILKLLIIVLISYIYSCLVSYDFFIEAFIVLMKWICLISISSWIFFDTVCSILPEIVNDNGVIYEAGGIVFFIKDVHRLCGIFWEPGIFAMYICFALCIVIINEYNVKKSTIFIYLLALILTQSTTGYTICILIGVMAYIHNAKKIDIKYLILVGISFLILLNWKKIINILLIFNYDIFVKLTTLQHASTGTRLYSFLINFKIFKENFLFGQGYAIAIERYKELMKLTYSMYHVDSQTSTSGIMLAAFGVGGGVYTFYWVLAILKNIMIKKNDKIILLIIVIILINVEPNTFFMLTYIVLFYWLQNCNKNYIKRNMIRGI